jgi:hypothetical protein
MKIFTIIKKLFEKKEVSKIRTAKVTLSYCTCENCNNDLGN